MEPFKYCEFKKLVPQDMTIEDKLILLRLIDGMQDTSHKHKILESLQIIHMNFKAII